MLAKATCYATCAPTAVLIVSPEPCGAQCGCASTRVRASCLHAQFCRPLAHIRRCSFFVASIECEWPPQPLDVELTQVKLAKYPVSAALPTLPSRYMPETFTLPFQADQLLKLTHTLADGRSVVWPLLPLPTAGLLCGLVKGKGKGKAVCHTQSRTHAQTLRFRLMWIRVLRAWCLVLGAWCLVLGVRRPGESAWIMKEGNGARGMGLNIVRGNTLKKDVELFTKNGVAQRYETEPLLLYGHKFHLRVYVVIANMNPLRVLVCKEGIVLLAVKKYNRDPATFKDESIHLTNAAVVR